MAGSAAVEGSEVVGEGTFERKSGDDGASANHKDEQAGIPVGWAVADQVQRWQVSDRLYRHDEQGCKTNREQHSSQGWRSFGDPRFPEYGRVCRFLRRDPGPKVLALPGKSAARRIS